jgi:hypothetical protein
MALARFARLSVDSESDDARGRSYGVQPGSPGRGIASVRGLFQSAGCAVAQPDDLAPVFRVDRCVIDPWRRQFEVAFVEQNRDRV